MKYELPYDRLQLIGLSKETVDALPQEVKTNLQQGELTPLMTINRQMGNGVFSAPVKLRIEEGIDGKADLVIYPMNAQLKNSLNISNDDFTKLKEGDLLILGGKYVQRDPETNCFLMVPEKIFQADEKIAGVEKVLDIELGAEQKKQMKEGKPVELDVGHEKVTVGLDMKEKEGFKMINGDMKEWQRQQEIIYDILHPEYVGIVQTDENRWEREVIKKEGFGSQTLKDRPAQTRSAGLSR